LGCGEVDSVTDILEEGENKSRDALYGAIQKAVDRANASATSGAQKERMPDGQRQTLRVLGVLGLRAVVKFKTIYAMTRLQAHPTLNAQKGHLFFNAECICVVVILDKM
jgi:hypothetical protein